MILEKPRYLLVRATSVSSSRIIPQTLPYRASFAYLPYFPLGRSGNTPRYIWVRCHVGLGALGALGACKVAPSDVESRVPYPYLSHLLHSATPRGTFTRPTSSIPIPHLAPHPAPHPAPRPTPASCLRNIDNYDCNKTNTAPPVQYCWA